MCDTKSQVDCITFSHGEFFAGALIGDPRTPRLVFFIVMLGALRPPIGGVVAPRLGEAWAYPPAYLDESK